MDRGTDRVYEEVMEKGWNEERRAFVQHYDSDTLDASNLIMPLCSLCLRLIRA